VVSMWSAGWPVRQTATSAESNSVTRGAKLKCIRCDEPIGEGPCGPSMPTRTPAGVGVPLARRSSRASSA
jgi:hypothetical protein